MELFLLLGVVGNAAVDLRLERWSRSHASTTHPCTCTSAYIGNTALLYAQL
eukprot:m.73311 g.73311  ORF g.73311 m.73311 type:complete len:51 (-) comp16122_c0_seq2:74-226(-)